jgi:DNA-binding transcriptional LysR family regulator
MQVKHVSHVSTESLVCALVLSEEGNFKCAAERLNTSQANAGREVKALQESWDLELFCRIRSGFKLTIHGRAAMRDIRVGLEHLDCVNYSATLTHEPFRVGHSLYVRQRSCSISSGRPFPEQGLPVSP